MGEDTHIISAQDANDFPAAVELDEEAFVEVLVGGELVSRGDYGDVGLVRSSRLTFFSSG